MSDAPILPFPKLRELWTAQNGALFFIKWMACAGAQVFFALAVGALFSRLNWDPYLPSPLLFWLLPVFLTAFALFGFHWRVLTWSFVTIAAYFAAAAFVWTSQWPSSLVAITSIGVSQSLLLIGIRRRVMVWAVTLPAAYIVCHYLDRWIHDGQLWFLVWQRLMSVGVPRLIAYEISYRVSEWSPRIIAAVVLGAALVWLMPPVTRSSQPKSAGD
jgi:hypothetical protein